MDSLFENQLTYTKQFYKELYSYFYFKRPIIIIFNVFFALYFLLGLSILFRLIDFEPEGFTVFTFILPLLFWTILILRYLRSVKTIYQQALELNQGKPSELMLIVTEEGIDTSHLISGNKSHIDFANVKKAIRTKNYYLLITSARICFAFKKDGFVKGDLPGFLSFLKAKGLKVKGS